MVLCDNSQSRVLSLLPNPCVERLVEYNINTMKLRKPNAISNHLKYLIRYFEIIETRKMLA